MELNKEDLTWLDDNIKLLRGAIAISQPTREKIYQIYNKISETPKQPTSCGRCFRNVKKEIIRWYQTNR